MGDRDACIDLCKSFEGETPPFLLLIQPGSEGLLYDPAAGALKAGRHLVDLFCEGDGDMCRQDFRLWHDDDSLIVLNHD
jgi:hypothetical protein